jgi:hypothetical protein
VHQPRTAGERDQNPGEQPPGLEVAESHALT